MAATEMAEGALLCAGRYRLARRLGSGGMATVWRGHDSHLERPVAVKVLSDTLAYDEDYVTRFRREARLAARLSHPHLVQVFDFGEEHRRPFLVMELVDGPSLDGLLRRQTTVDVDPSGLAVSLLQALEHVHRSGIVHRDIKPGNVLIGSDGRIRLTDFGIAQPHDATQLTGAGLVVGTLRYLAPEVIAGGPATPRSDLFALGRLLREVIDCAAVQAPPALCALAEQLVHEDPAARPASAAAALDRLQGGAPRAAAIAPHAPAAPHPRTTAVSPRRRAARPAPRRVQHSRHTARALTLLATLAVAGAIIAAVALARSGSGRTLPPPTSSSAPFQSQLDGIERAIDAAGR